MNKDKLFRIKDFITPINVEKSKNYSLSSYNKNNFLPCASTNLFPSDITHFFASALQVCRVVPCHTFFFVMAKRCQKEQVVAITKKKVLRVRARTHSTSVPMPYKCATHSSHSKNVLNMNRFSVRASFHTPQIFDLKGVQGFCTSLICPYPFGCASLPLLAPTGHGTTAPTCPNTCKSSVQIEDLQSKGEGARHRALNTFFAPKGHVSTSTRAKKGFGHGKEGVRARRVQILFTKHRAVPFQGKGFVSALVRQSSIYKKICKEICKQGVKKKVFANLVARSGVAPKGIIKLTKTKLEDLYSTHFPQLILSQNIYYSNKKFCSKKSFVSIIVPNIFWYSISKTSYTIVRPLINVSRYNLTMACITVFLPVYPDRSNFKIRYSRNRIRKQIIPSIQFFFNPKIETALFKFSEFYNRDLILKKNNRNNL